MPDSLGDRIKAYERVYQPVLTPNSPLIIRIDGKAFHTWTKGFERPFDERLINCMINAARDTARHMQGFRLAYTQSDEVSFLIRDTDSREAQGWFGYDLNKIVSVSASLFTAYFNSEASWRFPGLGLGPAFFDSRVFVVPADDVPNVFVWRQQDWHRNSVQMLARAHFSHAQLTGKKMADMHDMLYGVGVNWAQLDSRLKNGTFISKDGNTSNDPLNYYELEELINGPVLLD